MKKLCFGVFFKVLYCIKFDTVKVTQQLVGTFTRTIDPKCRYLTCNKGLISLLMNCKADVSAGDGSENPNSNRVSNVKQKATETNHYEVANRINDIIGMLLKPERRKLCVAAFFDIIKNDKLIDGDNREVFKSCLGCYKEELINKEIIYFPNLLAGLLLYVVQHVSNNDADCRQFVKTIDNTYLDSLEEEAKCLEGKIRYECDPDGVIDIEIETIANNVYGKIEKILEYMSSENHRAGDKFVSPPYNDPLMIKEKLNKEHSILEQNTTECVLKYYNFIRERFTQIGRQPDAYFNKTWAYVNDLYSEIKKKSNSTEEIYINIKRCLDSTVPKDDVLRNDPDYDDYWKIIVSFFIQNCAIFELEEGDGD